jgi:small ligand-binding sensory domain FIST
VTAADVEALSEPTEWHRFIGVPDGGMDVWIALLDPVSIHAEPFVHHWNHAYQKTPLIGGLASGSGSEEGMFVFRDRAQIPDGGVLVGLGGGVRVATIVSQGCRPIGEPLPVTDAENNVMRAIGSRPAYQVLTEAFESLSDTEKQNARGNLFAGFVMNEYLEEFHRGDFLIRTILGADGDSGAVAVGAYPRVGQTVQYQLRDAAAADADLRELCLREVQRGVVPAAAMLFSCGGRGIHMFGSGDHDARVLQESFGPVATAGFFCNGEIGPISGKSFVHGYTASVLLVE